MRLTYLDILEQCFHDKWRGYDKKEVDTFLHLVAEDFKELTHELEQLRGQLDRQQKQIRELEAGGGKDSGPLNGLNPELLKEKAKRIIDLARQEADRHLQEVDRELSQLKGEIEKLRREKAKMIETIKLSARTYFQERGGPGGESASHEPANHRT